MSKIYGLTLGVRKFRSFPVLISLDSRTREGCSQIHTTKGCIIEVIPKIVLILKEVLILVEKVGI